MDQSHQFLLDVPQIQYNMNFMTHGSVDRMQYPWLTALDCHITSMGAACDATGGAGGTRVETTV